MRPHPKGSWSPGEEEWVLMVPGREGLAAKADVGEAQRRIADCPFCPGSAATPHSYEVKLIPSGYPVVHADASDAETAAYGLHTVFLYTCDHDGRLVDQTQGRLTDLLEALAVETTRFLEDPKIEAVFGFHVSGDHFGPTVDHPHGQLIGFTFTPRRQTLAGHSCRICELATQEHSEPYIVSASDAGRVLVPPFARLPFEMWVVPGQHRARLADLRGDEVAGLARLVRAGLRACLDPDGHMPNYLLTIMQAPRGDSGSHHLRMELLPLHGPSGGMKRPGGLEVGAGIYVNPLLPTEAAERLRERLEGTDE